MSTEHIEISNPLNQPSNAYMTSFENARTRSGSLESQRTTEEVVGIKTKIASHVMFIVGLLMLVFGISAFFMRGSERFMDGTGFVIVGVLLLLPGAYGIFVVYGGYGRYMFLPSFD